MGKSITLFMWGYQPHFRIQLESRSRNVLEVIAPTAQPRAFLVGVRTPDKRNGYPVCVEPEDEDWDPRIFFECSDRAENIYATHPDHSLLYGDAPSMRDKPENIRKKSVREAVQEVTSAYDSQHGTVTFCGWPTRVEGYHVVPALQFNKAELLEYPQLSEPIQFEDWTSPTGFLDSVVTCLLEEATNALGKNEPGRFLGRTFPLDATGLLRDAGDRFCTTITLATGDIELQDVFDTLNVISSLPYEGAEAIGTLIFAPAGTEVVDIRVGLHEPVRLRNHKLARKMIETSGGDLYCLCFGAEGISGLGGLRDANADRVFRVTFSGHYKWDLYYKNHLLMKSSFGVPQLPSVRLKEHEFRSNARRLFPSIDREAERRLWSIVEAAIEQRHGTMIVVSAAAQDEANRFKKQSIGIKPIQLNSDLVHHLSGIDGAVLIDLEGICYAVGVILDGTATDEGDPSRGARFNSAIRYIASAKTPTMCLVVSEDGYVNMFPKLRSQIRKSDIDDRIALLKTQNIKNYHKTRNWLDEHRFYLTAEQCEVVNNELFRINSTPYEGGDLHIVIPSFKPHPDMNSTYYLPESGTQAEDRGPRP